MNLLNFWLDTTAIVQPYAGHTAPDGWLMCFGQAVSRTTYKRLFAKIAFTPTGDTTSGNATISSVSIDLLAAGVKAGMPVSGPGIPAGATVASVTANSVTLSADATATASGITFVVAPHGVGDGSATFNVPDLRGRVSAGKDDMGGTPADRLGITLSGTRGSTANGVITGLSSTAGLSEGMRVSGTGIGAGAVITAINSSTQVTLSVNNTATGTGSIRFGVVDGTKLGDAGGSQGHSITWNQLAPHTHGNTGTGGFLVAKMAART